MPGSRLPAMLPIWLGTATHEPFAPLEADAEAEVAIVGGGITGVTLALLLAEAGLSVLLLEAHSIGGGSTGHSTGNLYQLVSGGLHALAQHWSPEVARAVAQSRGEAIDLIERNIHQHGIACGFRRCALHWYADIAHAQPFIEHEFHAARQAGLPAHLASEWDEPLTTAVGPILVLPQQAQFHPLLYVRSLAQLAARPRCRLFEQSPVLHIDLERRTLATAHGTVHAHHVVLATHTPKGMHGVQAEMLPQREYALASLIEHATDTPSWPPGIYWGHGVDRHSVRQLQTAQGDYLIVVGEAVKTAQHAASDCMDRLEELARRCFGVQRVAYRWSAQSYRAADGLPYIGRSGNGAYIATGFGADGLSYGTLAAMILADQIRGQANPWSELYRPDRVTPLKSARLVMEETVGTATAFVEDRLTRRPSRRADDLAPGQAAILKSEGDTLAAYRDGGGELFVVSPVCTHMKCMVRWNDAERSWDCPCHGSRFAPDGTVIEGPALEPLKRLR